MKKALMAAGIALLFLVVYTQITIFAVPPIGAVPEGRTVVMLRLNKTNFIDSADAMCVRIQGYVSLMCRGMTMAGVVKATTIIARLPYSETIYKISTGGETYER
ncbi:hypothetical protein D3C76_470370 [compost metagenome]|jgi:hypothetical protein|uniref:hypothetical protein n=1 Tax=Pseudomonas TaxID=286 RepID=UPI000F9353D7|nr:MULTISPECIES: hypothetical protein [Pseudomonas]MCS4062221.1 hypothetical protein [Pseudomonas putida]MDD1991389.1 hypothetical protein [Pseudomonas putida]TCP74277.1 hypothetical protein EC849_11240 [Pseudomonas putida]HDS0918838.1 hypothetical protein [Pseudomonas putida]HDS0934383.1 hypothetical protein [Pseudomonas putida]